MSRNTKIAAVFGHPTRLFGHLRHTQVFTPSNKVVGLVRPRLEPLQWMPGGVEVVFDRRGDPRTRPHGDALQSYDIVRDRWVYVFVYKGTKGSSELLLELFIDRTHEIHVNPSTAPDERLRWVPERGGAVGSLKHELPRSVTGKKWHYAFIGLPFRLTNASVAKLLADDKIFHLVVPVDLSDKKVLGRLVTEIPGGTVASEQTLTIPVLLPFDVARQLSHDIEVIRTLRANKMGADGKRGQASRDDVENAKKYFFSRTLQDLVDHPTGRKLEDRFANRSADELRSFVESFERELTRLDLLAETIGTDLARWMDRELMRILLEGCIPDHGAEFLRALSEITSGLGECVAGIGYLAATAAPSRSGTFMHRLFSLRQALTEPDRAFALSHYEAFLLTLAAVQRSRIFRLELAGHELLQNLNLVLSPFAPGWNTADLKHMVEVFDEFVLTERGGKAVYESVRIQAEAIRTEALVLNKRDKVLTGGRLVVAFPRCQRSCRLNRVA